MISGADAEAASVGVTAGGGADEDGGADTITAAMLLSVGSN